MKSLNQIIVDLFKDNFKLINDYKDSDGDHVYTFIYNNLDIDLIIPSDESQSHGSDILLRYDIIYRSIKSISDTKAEIEFINNWNE